MKSFLAFLFVVGVGMSVGVSIEGAKKDLIHLFSTDDHTHQLQPKEEDDLEELLEEAKVELENGFKNPSKPSSGYDYGMSDNPGDVKFYLYSNPNDWSEFNEICYEERRRTQKLWVDGEIDGHPKFDPTKQWKFLIHGFLQNQNSSMPNLIVKEYLRRWRDTGERVNIVAVDWGRLAGNIGMTSSVPDYSKAVKNVEVAGKRVGQMIRFLKRLELEEIPNTDGIKTFLTPILDPQDVHIVGFSLGGMVAGTAGSYVYRKLNRKVGRITGLDPAGPFFTNDLIKMGRTLRKDDANSLDVIHTNWGGFGVDVDIGDTDFHPNGGANMNPASGPMLSQIQDWCKSKFFFWQSMSMAACSHNMSPIYYAFSINHRGAMNACQCGSWTSYISVCPCTVTAEMGEYWTPDKSKTGPFYIKISTENVDEGSKTLENKLRSRSRFNTGGLF